MSPYQLFISSLNRYITEQSGSTEKQDKILRGNNIHVKNSIMLLGSECFNTHLKNVLDYCFEQSQKNNETFDEFYSGLGHSFHSGFRKYDVSERFYPQKFKSYLINHMQLNGQEEVMEKEYNIDSAIDTINWVAYSLTSNFWDILHSYALEQYNAKVTQ